MLSPCDLIGDFHAVSGAVTVALEKMSSRTSSDDLATHFANQARLQAEAQRAHAVEVQRAQNESIERIMANQQATMAAAQQHQAQQQQAMMTMMVQQQQAMMTMVGQFMHGQPQRKPAPSPPASKEDDFGNL
jgi:hypothetical protein